MPSEILPVLTRCHGCRHPLVDQINKRLVSQSPEAVSKWLASLGDDLYLSAVSLRKHKQAHLTDPSKIAQDRLERPQTPRKGKAGDLAALVRDQVFARVEEGDLDPTLAEGLRAQEMLDRRAAQGEDRDMMLALAGLLSGAAQPIAVTMAAPLPALSDGLDAEREADLATFRELLGGDAAEAANPYRRGED